MIGSVREGIVRKGDDRLAAAFRSLTGEEPSGIWSAPGRVNLIGEHTDYNDGHVLPFAIAQRTRAALRLRQDGRVRLSSGRYDQVVEAGLDELDQAEGWSAYVLGTVWALREAGVDLPGLDVVVDSSIPPGSGLSSSAALECAVALGLAELTGSDLTRLQLAQAGQRAENDVVHAPVGLMDQAAVMLAEEGAALLLDCRTLETRQVPLGLDEDELCFLITDTRVSHDLADGQYADRRDACRRAAQALGVPALRDVTPERLSEAARLDLLDPVQLRRVRHVVGEEQRVGHALHAIRARNWEHLGRLLTESHASLRDDYEVSVPELDGAVEAALEAGALGARVTGGGFGGNTVVLARRDDVGAIDGQVQQRAQAEGWPRPNSSVVRPATGARRER